MKVKLISITNPVITGINNPEELISYCARVSNPSNQLNIETAPKLLRYLITHKHWSPFEMVSMTIEIQTNRAIAAQILRHRSFSFQEFSQRYSTATELEPIEFRKQGKTNRQVGDEEVQLTPYQASYIERAEKSCLAAYEFLIDSGIAKECARMILPLSTRTTMYMSGTIRSWIHYIELRTTEDTQKEHRKIALEIKNIFKTKFPNVAEAMNW
jgi:thymidylate synthase (FAD)